MPLYKNNTFIHGEHLSTGDLARLVYYILCTAPVSALRV